MIYSKSWIAFMLTKSRQELDSVLVLYNYNVCLLVSGTILWGFSRLRSISSFHNSAYYKACIMRLVYFPFPCLFRCPLYWMYYCIMYTLRVNKTYQSINQSTSEKIIRAWKWCHIGMHTVGLHARTEWFGRTPTCILVLINNWPHLNLLLFTHSTSRCSAVGCTSPLP